MSLKASLLAIVCMLGVAAPAFALESVNGTVFTSSPVAVKVGQDFIIALPSNASTGYSWSAKTTGSPVVVEGYAYQLTASSGEKRMVGGGGQQLFVLEATKVGMGTVTFSYGRPWQKGVKPARTITFTITVTQ